MSTVLTTTERHRPGSLRNSVRRLFTLASNGRSDSRPGMFDHAQNTSIQNATFTINQYGTLTVDRSAPVTVTMAEGQIASGITAAPSRVPDYDPSPRPRRESPDVYVDCLLTENRGYPLWIPSPNRCLPAFNRTLGVSVGDVGVLTPEGGFDFLFNIFHHATHPINAPVGVPEAFIPFTPAPAAADTQQFVEWKAGTFLADESMVRVDDGRNQSTIMLEATGVEGAVLMIPEDIHATKLKITTRLRKYVEENIVGWYRFVKHTLGHDIENGDLRVVYGCRKSSGFGMATAFNRGWRENTRLSFFAEGFSADISRCPYRWSHTGSAEVKAGHSGEDNIAVYLAEPIRNQCLFVNTIDTRISAETWKTVELSTVTQVMPESTSGEPNSGKKGPTAKSGATGSTAGSTSLFRSERAFHLSVILQDVLETIVRTEFLVTPRDKLVQQTQTPGLTAYMVCDDDWAPFVSDSTVNTHDLIDQTLQNRIIIEEQGMLFFCDENDANSSEKAGHRHMAHIRCRRVDPIENSSNDNCSHWQAKRYVNVAIGESAPAVRVFGLEKKKEQSQNRGADSLPNIPEISTSSDLLAVTEMTDVSTPFAGQVAQMRKDKNKEKAEERRNDIIETSLSGTAVVLGLVNEAAQFSNFPGLQDAASLALGIVTIVQAVKESNRQYGLLARDATDFIAAIWRSYLQSTHKEDWLSPDLRDVITELVITLTDITEFVNDKAKRNKFTKILSSKADPSQVLEYRERIKSAMKKFELTSHLKLNEMIQQVYRDQLIIAKHLSQRGIESLPEGAMVLHALGKSRSGFDMWTNANTSLATLPSSAAFTQPSSTATSRHAVDEPAFLIEGSTQSPHIVLTRADTLPPADGTSSNSPQPSSPLVSPSRPSQPQLPPSSLPSSPSFTDSPILSPLSASAGSGTVVSATLVGSLGSDSLISASAAAMRGPSANSKSNNIDDKHTYDHEEHDHDIDISVGATHALPSDPGPVTVRMGRRTPTSSGNAILRGMLVTHDNHHDSSDNRYKLDPQEHDQIINLPIYGTHVLSTEPGPPGDASVRKRMRKIPGSAFLRRAITGSGYMAETESSGSGSSTWSDADTAVPGWNVLSDSDELTREERQIFHAPKKIDKEEPPWPHNSLVSVGPRRHAPQKRQSVIMSGPAGDSRSQEGSDSESRGRRSPTWSDTDTAVSEWDVFPTPSQLMQKGRQLFDQIDEEDEDDEQSEKQPSQYSSLLPEEPRRRSFRKVGVPRPRESGPVAQPRTPKGDSAQHPDVRQGDERYDNGQEELELTSRSAPWQLKAPYTRYPLIKVIDDSDAKEDKGQGMGKQEHDSAHIVLASLDISP